MAPADKHLAQGPGGLLALLLLLALSGPARAGDEESPARLTAAEAADRVLAAFEEEDAETVRSLASRADVDPWIVADELCLRGRFDAAAAYARVVSGKDNERLPEYVASRPHPERPVSPRVCERAIEALRAQEPSKALAVLDAAEGTPSVVVRVRMATARGMALRRLGRFEESGKSFLEASENAREIGDLRFAAFATGQAGNVAFEHDDLQAAVTRWRAKVAVERMRENERELALTLGNLALAHLRRGELLRARACQMEGLRLREQQDDPPALALALRRLGDILHALADLAGAEEHLRRALEIERGLGNRSGEAAALASLGNVHDSLGNYARALDLHDAALEIHRELRNDPVGAARALTGISNVYYALGEHEKALAYAEKALRITKAVNHRSGMAAALANVGNAHLALGDRDRALAFHQGSLEVEEEIGNPGGVATSLLMIGVIHHLRGESGKALSVLTRALSAQEALGNRAAAAMTLASLGRVHRHLGHMADAAACLERSLEIARELGLQESEVVARLGLAHLHLDLGAPAKAAREARRAVELLPRLVRRLAEPEGASARERWTSVFEVGVGAALALDDVEQVSFFLESGRAGTLLESLGGRRALWAWAIPEKLRVEEGDARAAEIEAAAAHRAAYASGRVSEIRARRGELEAARDRTQRVLERIQREAKRGAGVVYPEAATLGTIQGTLQEGEALVVYGLLEKAAIALVVTPGTARWVPLGERSAIGEACRAALPGVEPYVREEKCATLRQRVIDPLDLPDDVERVLISPDGVLGYVPFAVLLPDREVVFVPSGTTYALLAEERDLVGEGVLAVGDPAYGAGRADRAHEVFRTRSRGPLVRLPASRKEVEAVGDVLLLGKEATETALAEKIASRPRWRAIHLACHGLVNPTHPMRSSLALTPDVESDGFLSVPEVFRTRFPADLVVLSACETAKGRVYGAEGIVGLTRAFMFAGAPRVLCSLWKVDDEATRALMTKFYELWNPGEGKGLGAAAALKVAQAFVRSREKWARPYYWAAWVLWGLP